MQSPCAPRPSDPAGGASMSLDPWKFPFRRATHKLVLSIAARTLRLDRQTGPALRADKARREDCREPHLGRLSDGPAKPPRSRRTRKPPTFQSRSDIPETPFQHSCLTLQFHSADPDIGISSASRTT